MSKPSLEEWLAGGRQRAAHMRPRKMEPRGGRRLERSSGAGHQQVRPWAQAYSPLRPGLHAATGEKLRSRAPAGPPVGPGYSPLRPGLRLFPGCCL